MIDNYAFAEQAYSYRDSGIPYSKLDCQAFVERVLADCGVKRNWKGSNDMWRNALTWKGTVDEAIEKFGTIPPGAWLFTWADDGGEKKRGYHDDLGNAKHVGIFTGKGKGAMHSSTGGVQQCAFPDPERWNRVGLAMDIDYFRVPETDQDIQDLFDLIIKQLQAVKQNVETLKGLVVK